MLNQLSGIFIVLVSVTSFGYDLNPHFDSSEERNLVTEIVATKESVVEINGFKFREIQYKTEKYYLRFLEKGASLQDESYCLKPGGDGMPRPPEPYQVIGQVEVGERTEAFIQGLRVRCQKVENLSDMTVGLSHKNKDGSKTSLELNPFDQSLGLSKKQEDGTGKKVLVNPTGAGAAVNW